MPCVGGSILYLSLQKIGTVGIDLEEVTLGDSQGREQLASGPLASAHSKSRFSKL